MPTAYLSHPSGRLHAMTPGHPESPARLEAIELALRAAGLWDLLRHEEPPPAAREDLVRVHDPDYLDLLERLRPRKGLTVLDADTSMNQHSLDAAWHAAGAVVRATELVLAGTVHHAFCAVRPPGHHAERARAMGFCLLNNVAVGAAWALARGGLSRVAIVDFDVHHGNGTEDIFADSDSVLLCSTFQHPLYPFVGVHSRAKATVNVPLDAGTDGPRYRQEFERHVLPALEAFRPELIFFSAGFDAHQDDPLAALCLREDDYAWITDRVAAVADRTAKGRMVSTLEGGYDLQALGRSVVAHLEVMASR